MNSPIQSKISTIFIPVRQIETARDWYCDILGIEASEKIVAGHLYIIFLEGGSHLVLDSNIFAKRIVDDAPLFHFNTDSVEDAYAFLNDKGVVLTSDIENGHWFTFKDPDGNTLMVCRPDD
ncbi:VOC family protein [Alteribacillus sp. HJP-4]|uniref:VOC family protein n=1 Tax=Alteribacillus sp. HJP-4 TaxID=2775394 RepID=UPI0035CD1A53